jgi:hypothetical protein
MHRQLTQKLDVWADHSTFENPWVARSEHFVVRTTKSYGLAADLARGLESMLGHFRHWLAIDFVPNPPLQVWVFATRAEYNAFGEANGEHHSSFYGSFHAAAHAERPVAAEWIDNPTLLRMQVTHSVVHQYLAAAFPGTTKPAWIDEGLAAFFTSFWDDAWWRAEYDRLKANGQLVPAERLLADGIAAYANDTHSRFVQLGVLFHWLLRWREETRSTPGDDGRQRGPFRDWLVEVLQGRDASNLPVHALLTDRRKLAAEFRAFEFPK